MSFIGPDTRAAQTKLLLSGDHDGARASTPSGVTRRVSPPPSARVIQISLATRDAFLESYNAAAFPNIYRQTHGEMVTDAALKLPDLTEDQRKGVTAIKDEIGAKYKDLRPKAVQEAIDMQKFQSAMMAAKDDEARQKVMEKMQARSLADLVRMAIACGATQLATSVPSSVTSTPLEE